MTHYDLIRDRLDELHVHFPSYGERSVGSEEQPGDLEIIGRIFAKETAAWTEEKINLVFDALLRGKRFPILEDVLESGKNNQTQAEKDAAVYRSLKWKTKYPDRFFLSRPEEAFIQAYENEHGQSLFPVSDRGGSGFRRLPMLGES